MVLYAHYTRDAVLIEAVSNGDVHAESARRITGKAVITPQDRFLFGKKVNFAVIYGAGGSRLAKEISIAQGSIYPPHKGMQLLDRFYKAYPRAKVLQQGVAKRIDERGYIVTTLGRRLYVDPDKAYKGVNYLIQGGGAELLKLAQVAIQREFPGTQVLVVHDQIVLDTELEERDQLRVKELMESCLQLSLPIKASLDSSSVSWGHTGH
jgi:DNA polymerase I-like protein with 3'-5' exonuclease and polymerase domains